MRGLGQEWWDPETRTFHLDSPEALEAMNMLVYTPVYELGIEAYADIHGVEQLYNGMVGLASGSMNATSVGEGEWDIPIDTCLYPPAVPGAEPTYVGEAGWGFVVPSQAENADIGVEFMKYLTTYEGNKEYCRIYGGIVSAVTAVNSDDELYPVGTLVGDAVRRGAKAQPLTKFYGSGYGMPGEAAGIIGDAVTAVYVGDKMPKEALEDAQAALEEMLERWDSEH
jgi:ABC-type glycerol-3-phosphate transport system substrate-binding protein